MPTYSWTLTPIPNWTCSVVTVPLSDARLPSTWLTNCVDHSTRLQSPTKKIVGCKVLQFIHTMKIKKMLDHKTLRCKIHNNFFKRKRWTRARTLSLVTICLNKVCSKFVQLAYYLTALKQSFYMSRIKRKECPKKYSRIPRKSYLNFEIFKPWQIGGVEKLSRSCRVLMNLHSLFDFLSKLEGFNTWSLNVIS